jgi:hypothetical protein
MLSHEGAKTQRRLTTNEHKYIRIIFTTEDTERHREFFVSTAINNCHEFKSSICPRSKLLRQIVGFELSASPCVEKKTFTVVP